MTLDRRWALLETMLGHSLAAQSRERDENRDEKIRTRPPPKGNLMENFSGLKEKPFQAGGAYKNRIKTQQNHIHHRNLSSVDPIFSEQKKSSALEQGGVWFLFPRNTVSRVLFRKSVVIFFFPYNPHPPIPTTPGRPTPESLISVHFGSISGPLRVRFGVLGGVRVGSGRVASVREKKSLLQCWDASLA